MRVRVHTASGAMYLLDSGAMTWERAHPTRDIINMEGENAGKLAIWPTIVTGESMQFRLEDPSHELAYPTVTTTQVVRTELL